MGTGGKKRRTLRHATNALLAVGAVGVEEGTAETDSFGSEGKS